ncbi:pyridoxal-dependent decarboxylase [Allokutzneria oryzae]|uniref:Pyridoxal-dependent decarboxylase n=1 Tax=Allokutzneria oryzae TaxID=1378989 RepID=A0ABV5ZXH3_9PSEU
MRATSDTTDQVPEEADFRLDPDGLTPARRRAALATLKQYFATQKANFLGYQVNEAIAYRAELAEFLDYNTNNIGDPFVLSTFTLHSKWVEQAVLDYYARLWNAQPRRVVDQQLDPESYWGYVLTMGSTEGNVYGLWNARDYLGGKALMVEPEPSDCDDGRRQRNRVTWVRATTPPDNENAYTPVAFYSQDTHYSVAKAVRVLDIPTFYEVGTKRYPHANPLSAGEPWPAEVPSLPSGAIDIDKLEKLVEFFASVGHPILLVLNYGTTFKGAYDDVGAIAERLRPVFRRYGLDRRRVKYGSRNGKDLVDERAGYWFHIDAALGGTYMPFVEKAIRTGALPAEAEEDRPDFDFRIPETSSIVASGHKFPGAPWPCGIYMTKVKYEMQPPPLPAYVGSPDTTFGGSRNAFSPIVWWDYLARHPEATQIELAVRAEHVARYAVRKLSELAARRQEDLWVERTPLALSVRFKQPNEEIVFKYSLSTITLDTAEARHLAHLYVMTHVTEELIDRLVADLESPDAFPEQPAEPAGPIGDWGPVEDVERLAMVPIIGRGFR